jgi:hypothetical protein
MLTATNNLSDISSASSGRTNLGLVIGTNVQAYDADLAAIAGLTSAADRVPYYTGSGAASLATFSTAGRALVDDADAAAQRTTLGLGTMAVAATSDYLAKSGGTMTGQIVAHSTGVQFSDGTSQTTAPVAGVTLGKAIAFSLVF